MGGGYRFSLPVLVGGLIMLIIDCHFNLFSWGFVSCGVAHFSVLDQL